MAEPERDHIPQSGEELTADWFTAALGVRVDGATVTRVSSEVIGSGVGFVGELHRCALEWDTDDPELPRSLVVKVPSKVLQNRVFGEGLLAYEREIRVYRDLGGRLGLPMPRHWYSAMDPNPAAWMLPVVTFLFERLPVGAVGWLIDRLLKFGEKSDRRYVLVLEDVADAHLPTQVGGGSVDDVRVALDVLARFHAANWLADETVEAHDDHLWPLSRTPKVVQATYRRNHDAFVERFGSMMGDGLIARMDDVQERLPELVGRMVEPPWTVLHGDYRLDNLLFRPSGEIVVVDYQLLCYGRPGWDVAYFITTALSPDHRPEEDSLLRSYHDALVDAGVSDYSLDDLRDDVLLTKDLLVHRFLGTGDFLDTQLDGHDDTFVDLASARILGWVD